jgi:hypothetical protein
MPATPITTRAASRSGIAAANLLSRRPEDIRIGTEARQTEIDERFVPLQEHRLDALVIVVVPLVSRPLRLILKLLENDFRSRQAQPRLLYELVLFGFGCHRLRTSDDKSTTGKRSSPRFRDPHPRDPMCAHRQARARQLRSPDPRVNKLDHLRDGESMRNHDRLGAAVAAGGEQFERPAAIGFGAAAEGSRHLAGGLSGPGGKTTRFPY